MGSVHIPWGLYEPDRQEVRPLTDEEAAIVLNRDPLIGREWRRWNAMSGNRGSLIVLDAERVKHVLQQAKDGSGSETLAA